MKRERPDAMAEEHHAEAETASKRISAMIEFTKTYQDIGIQAPTWQNVRALIEKCGEAVNPGQIRIVNEVPSASEIFADPLIGKVILNLMHNAVIYGGDITCIHFSSRNGATCTVIVCEDDGVGISEEMKGRLFTKGFGNGHGLGLFLSREILAITGITITEESEPGKGAKFIIMTPKNCFRAA